MILRTLLLVGIGTGLWFFARAQIALFAASLSQTFSWMFY